MPRHKDCRGYEHHQVRIVQGPEEPLGDPRAGEGTGRRPHGDEGEYALTRLIRVEVVGKAPELGDHQIIENPDPDKKDDAIVPTGPRLNP